MQLSRVRAIFLKDFTDILRDRRTLIGMVVIPVVLYPSLILIFGPTTMVQTEAIRHEAYVIVVPDARQGARLQKIIDTVLADVSADRSTTQPDGTTQPSRTPKPPRVLALDRTFHTDPNHAVRRDPEIHLAVEFEDEAQVSEAGLAPTRVRIVYDARDFRSQEAARRAENLFHHYAAMRQEQLRARLAETDALPDLDERLGTMLSPVEVEIDSVTQLSVFLQIMPVILVLMTVTGAVYPAIDLTAGERERGTLETLMVAPVPTLDIVAGKFLVVIMVSLITALLNVISVGASVRLIQVDESLNLPIANLLITLVAIVPLSMLSSAALIAVCSFARSFKEAQNYVMPVVIAALVPAIMGSMPGATLSGGTRVVPIENIVLLVRDLATRDVVPWSDVAIVLLSTCLYAGAAVAVASKLFGNEAVTFADAGSYRSLLYRRFFKPMRRPTAAQALLTVAILFPIWFHVQGLVATTSVDELARTFRTTILLMVPTLALPSILLCLYLKIDLRETFSLRPGAARGWLGALLFGLGSWAVAIQLHSYQQQLWPMPEAIRESLGQSERAIGDLPLWLGVLFVGLIPAVCEETLFRGFLLSGLRTRLRKGWAIVGVAVVFALYHGLVYRLPITALLGVGLAYLCWQSRSIFPAILAHAMHNSAVVIVARSESLQKLVGLTEVEASGLPVHIWLPAVGMVILAIALLVSVRTNDAQAPPDADSDEIAPTAADR